MLANDLIRAVRVARALPNGTVTSAMLAAGAAVGNLTDGSVSGAKLSDTTVTNAKLNLSDGGIAGAKLTDGTVGLPKLNIARNTIVTGDATNKGVAVTGVNTKAFGSNGTDVVSLP